MESLLALAFLACPVGMGLMMWFMAKGMGGRRQQPTAPTTIPTTSLDALRAEHERLGRQIEQLEEPEPVVQVAR